MKKQFETLNDFIKDLNKTISSDKILKDILIPDGDMHDMYTDQRKGYILCALKEYNLKHLSSGRDRVTYKFKIDNKEYVLKIDISGNKEQNLNEIYILKKYSYIENLPKLYYSNNYYIIEEYIKGKLLDDLQENKRIQVKDKIKKIKEEIRIDNGLILEDTHEENVKYYNNKVYFIDLGLSDEENFNTLIRFIKNKIGQNFSDLFISSLKIKDLIKVKRMYIDNNKAIIKCIEKHINNLCNELKEILKENESQNKEAC